MKKIFIILLGILPLFVSAQTLDASQKQEALNIATQFCNLLTRFCYGERQLTTQINALCSGADCSAYDDIKTNKEVTLRNYLMAIQQKFPKKLATEISAPSLSDCQIYEEPVISLSLDWGKASGSDVSTTIVHSLNKDGIADYFVVFNVTQRYSSLGKSTQKKVIYSVKNKKITALITSQGSYISFLNGTVAYSNKNFAKAGQLFESAANNDSAGRGSLKKASYGLAMCS